MSLYEEITARKAKIALVGLGYVGMPIAVEFAKYVDVIGFDINAKKVDAFKHGKDPTGEVGNDAIAESGIEWTTDERKLRNARFIIVAVPTPINADTTPDLHPLVSASTIVGRNLSKGSIVVYESTVYPGVTEETCLPILEKESGITCGRDFKIGYSPERINPGDKKHRLSTITKIVSGMDLDTLDEIANIYSIVVKAGVYKASSIKVAEAAKVIENSQRDINIAFMNELSIIFNKMGIDTLDVLNAAETKWNFLPFRPGLVGGHCIGIDPYYLTYRAEQFGYHSQIILSGRRINDGMGKYIAEQAVKQLISADNNIQLSKIGILGISFKANCPDTRNTKIFDIIKELWEYGIKPIVCDPIADAFEVKRFYDIELVQLDEIKNLDCLIFAVEHSIFGKLSNEKIDNMFKDGPNNQKVIIDIKGVRNKNEMQKLGYKYWRL